MIELCPYCNQPQESHGSGCTNLPPPPAPQDWQPCPLCDGKGLIVRFAGGGGTVAVRYVCGYCLGSGVVRTEPHTTDANHDGQWQRPFNDTEEFIKMSDRNHTCWKTEIDSLFELNGDTWDDVEANTMTNEDMEKVFDAGFGGVEGCEFTLWTKKYVYFPVCYDGAESVDYVSRHPNGKPTPHIGG